MLLRFLLPLAAGWLRTIAIATGGFSIAYAQSGLPLHDSRDAIEAVQISELPVQIDDELWGAIKDSEGAKVFEEYVKQYPNGRYVARAKERFVGVRETARSSVTRESGAANGPVIKDDPETKLWRVVVQGESAGGYEVFLKHYPKGKYALLATRRLKIVKDEAAWRAEGEEQGAWLAADSEQTVESYAAYLARYPGGRYASLAQVRANTLRQDAALKEENRIWQLAEKGGRSAVDAYLANYPKGRHASTANLKLAKLIKEEVEMHSGKAVKDCPDCPEMVVIPPGSFQMGGGNEKPVHTVRIERPFAIAKSEVTQGQWAAIMGTNPCKGDPCDDCPVEGINWNDARAYVDKLSRKTGRIYSLPSEAEWEYACRAGERQEYCGSDTVDSVAWHGAVLGGGNSGGKVHPVAQKQANAFGLFDMSGNVWEWTEDCYHDNYKGAPTDGTAWMDGDCQFRVLRGGSWISGPSYASSHRRLPLPAGTLGSSYGFRPVWRLR